jgi:predicted nucleotidyltransferase
MSLSKIFPALPAEQTTELNFLTEKLKALPQMRAMILFGSYARGDFRIQAQKNRPKSDFDLILMTENNADIDALEPKLAAIFKQIHTPSDWKIFTLSEVHKKRKSYDHSFIQIFNEGILLFENTEITWENIIPFQQTNADFQKEITQHNFEEYFGQAFSFYEYAQNFVQENQLQLAVFMIYKSLALCYKTLGIVCDKPLFKSLALEALHQNAIGFFPILKNIFLEEDLEKLSPFYKGNFDLNLDPTQFPDLNQIENWLAKTQKLLEKTKKISLDWIANIKS